MKQQARTILNKTLPRLLKPTKGCIYKFTKEWKLEYLTFEVGDEVELVKLDTKYESYFLHPKIRDVLEIPKHIMRDRMEIVGIEPTLEDILEALGADYIRGRIVIFSGRGEAPRRKSKSCKWQYGKSFDNQDPEFHAFIVEVLGK